MLHKLLFVFAVCITSTVQAQRFEWMNNFGADSYSVNPSHFINDAQDNIYCVGSFGQTVDFDPGPGVHTLQAASSWPDGFICKLDSAGNLLWAKQIAGVAGEEDAVQIVSDDEGYLYVAGKFKTSASYDNGVHTFNGTGTSGLFLLKLDTDGQFIWGKQPAGTAGSSVTDMVIDNTGKLYLTGFASGALFLKLDSAGNTVWSRSMNSSITSKTLTLDPAGNLLVGGYFHGTQDFNPSLGVSNLTAVGNDGFLLKLTSNGSFGWVKQFGGTGQHEEVKAIAVDAAGNLLLVGRFTGTFDADPGPGTYPFIRQSNSFNASDAFVVKLDVNANFLWAKALWGSNGAYFRDIDVDTQGNVYGLGMYYNYVDFDPGPGSYMIAGNEAFFHYFLLKLSSAGDFKWVYELGESVGSDAAAIDVDNQNFIYTLGIFTGTADFAPGPDTVYRSPSTGKAFVLKLGPDSCVTPQYTVSNFLPLQCEQAGFISIHATSAMEPISFIWNTSAPTFDTSAVLTNPGIYRLTLVDSGGCWQNAAFVVAPATGNGGSSTLTASACGGYYFYGGYYQTTGTYTRVLSNLFGCDSTVTLNLTIYPTQSTSFTETACGSYTFNGQTYTQNGVYTQHYSNVHGCDSTVSLHLILNHPNDSQLTQTACESYTLNGQTYTGSGTYTQILNNAQGCDSIVTLYLTIHGPTGSSLTELTCESYTLNGQTYTQSGTYTQTLSNTHGCDSIVTLYLTIHGPTGSSLTEQACENYTWNGQTYTNSGTYTQMLSNTHGCDSTVTLYLTIHEPTGSFLSQQACKSYVFNGQTYTQSGTFLQTFTASTGCDSMVTLSLTIVGPNTSVTQNGFTLTANAAGNTYQWINCSNNSLISEATGISYSPVTDGNYAVIVTQNSCSDTSACYTIAGMGISENGSETEIRLYPNPAQEQITLQISGGWQNSTLRVVTLTGQIIHTETLSGQQTVLDVAEYAAGVYWVEITQNGQVYRMKWVKQ